MKTDKDPRALRVRDVEDNEGIPLPYVQMGDLCTWLMWLSDRKVRQGHAREAGAILAVAQQMLALELEHAVATMD